MKKILFNAFILLMFFQVSLEAMNYNFMQETIDESKSSDSMSSSSEEVDVFDFIPEGPLEILRELHQKDPDIFNQLNTHGESPLHLVLDAQTDSKIINYIAERTSGATALSISNYDTCPLGLATMDEIDANIVPLLAKKIAAENLDIDTPAADLGETALWLETSQKCDFQSVHELLKAGADPTKKDLQVTEVNSITNANLNKHDQCVNLLKEAQAKREAAAKALPNLRMFTQRPIDNKFKRRKL